MIHRRRAYYGALKFYFHKLMLMGIERRSAYLMAKNAAAYNAFTASTDHLTHITL